MSFHFALFLLITLLLVFFGFHLDFTWRNVKVRCLIEQERLLTLLTSFPTGSLREDFGVIDHEILRAGHSVGTVAN